MLLLRLTEPQSELSTVTRYSTDLCGPAWAAPELATTAAGTSATSVSAMRVVVDVTASSLALVCRDELRVTVTRPATIRLSRNRCLAHGILASVIGRGRHRRADR